jgi:uncharacterized peroxidase-related enzyme
MAYIDLKNELPGIRGLMTYCPETALPLNELVETLLRDDNNSLSRGERELIATYVSYLNDCFFCQNVHGALAGHYLGCSISEIDAIKQNFVQENLSPKIKALLKIAEKVQQGGKNVSSKDVEDAKKAGASELEIHDTVLIAAAFCMYNRYVDGLGTWCPDDRQFYVDRAPERAEAGYLSPLK